jgi:hypothetical protein
MGSATRQHGAYGGEFLHAGLHLCVVLEEEERGQQGLANG